MGTTRQVLKATKQVEIDFGTEAVPEKSFLISDTDVHSASRIVGSQAYEAATNKDADEAEMDALHLSFAPGTDQFTVYAKALEGDVYGAFKINYIVS